MLISALSERLTTSICREHLCVLFYVPIILFSPSLFCCSAARVLSDSYVLLSPTSFPEVSTSHTLLSTTGCWGGCAVHLFIKPEATTLKTAICGAAGHLLFHYFRKVT